jgi:hypothetical protein
VGQRHIFDVALCRVERDVLLIRLPHLSRFGIFGRPQSRPAVTHPSVEIASALN